MYESVNEWDFVNAFRRLDEGGSFSHEGLRALYAYLTELEGTLGEESELKAVKLETEWVEYESFEDYLEAYFTDYQSLEELGEDRTVIRVGDKGFIVEAH